MGIKFSNLASTTLSSGISSSATSISVTSASEFPAIGAGDYFYASIGFGDGSEIVKVTSVSGSTFTVTRGQDGSTAAAWASGDTISLRVVAAALTDLSAESLSIDGGTVSGDVVISGSTTDSSAHSLDITDSSGNSNFKVRNDRRQFFQGVYAHFQGSSGLYVTNAATFRGGIRNDTSGQPLIVMDSMKVNDDLNVVSGYELNGTEIIDSSRNLTNIGAISSGPLAATNNSNATSTISITNTTVGTAARANLRMIASSAQLDLFATSSGYTGVSGWGDAGIISSSSSASNGIKINAQDGGVDLQIGTTTQARLTEGGNFVVGGTHRTAATLEVVAENTAGSPAMTAGIKLKGYEARGMGIHYFNTSYSGKEWFSGVKYGGSFNEWIVGYDASTGKSEYNDPSHNEAILAVNGPLEKVTVNGILATGRIDAEVLNNNDVMRLAVGSNADFKFSADSTSGYETSIHMDNTGLDIGHNSASRSLNLKTSSTDRITISGNGAVSFNGNSLSSLGTVTSTGTIFGNSFDGGSSGTFKTGSYSASGMEAYLGRNVLSFKRDGTSYIDQLGTGSISIRLGSTNVAGLTISTSGVNVAQGVLNMGGTTVITSARNLTNIGTISSGAITASGHIAQPNNYEIRGTDTGGAARTLLRVNNSNKYQIGWSGAGDVEIVGGSSYTPRITIDTSGDVKVSTDLLVLGEADFDGGIVVRSQTNAIGYTQLGNVHNESSNDYVRGNLLFQRDQDQITWDEPNNQWVHAGGSSTDWSMLLHDSSFLNIFSGPQISNSTAYSHAGFKNSFLRLSINHSSGRFDFQDNVLAGVGSLTGSGQQLILNAGESESKVTGQTNEWVYVNAESGLSVNTPDSSHSNWESGYSVNTTLIKGDGITISGNSVATEAYVNTQVSNLVASAPGSLDTLNELAAALGDDANFSTTVTNSIATKLPLAGGTLTGALVGTSGEFTSLDINGNADFSNYINFSTNNNGLIRFGSRKAFGSTSSWLYIDPSSEFSSGVYINNSVKVDGGLIGSYNEALQLRTGNDTALTLNYTNQDATFAGNISGGTVTTTGVTSSGDINVNSNRINMSGSAPFIKFEETGVTNTPEWWVGSDSGTFSVRLNNTGSYPITVQTDAENDDVSYMHFQAPFFMFGHASSTPAADLRMYGTGNNYLRLYGSGANDFVFDLQGTSSTGNINFNQFTLGIDSLELFTLAASQTSEKELRLRNNRQDAGNVPVSSVVGYNSDQVAKMVFYRGTGGSTGYIRFQDKYDNSASLRDVFQVGGNSDNYGVDVLNGGYRIDGTTVIDSSRNFTANSRLTFSANSHYFEAGTNSISFKNSSGVNYLTINNVGLSTSYTISSGAITSTGNFSLNKADGFAYLSNVGTGNSGIYVRGIGSSGTLRSHSTTNFTWEVTGGQKMDLNSSGVLNAIGGYRLNGTTVINSSRELRNITKIFGSGDLEALTLNHSTYTILRDPAAHPALQLGDTADKQNYYSNDTHRFRDRASATQVIINNAGLDIKAGGLLVDGSSIIDTDGDIPHSYRETDASNATAGPGWVTVAENTNSRKHGEIIVSDNESSDHAFIRIDWLRSYADSVFTVLNTGGHANRITGVRVLSEDSGNTYGTKYLQIYVTTSSDYHVKVMTLTTPGGYLSHTATTPVVENTKTGYSLHGSQLENLDAYSFAVEEGIQSGGDMRVRRKSNAEVRVQADGDYFPSLRIERINGSSKTDSQWDFQVGSTGNLHFKDTTNLYYPLTLTNAGNVYLGSDSNGSNERLQVYRSNGNVNVVSGSLQVGGTTVIDSNRRLTGGGTAQHILTSDSDAPLKLTSTDATSGIKMEDDGGSDSLYYRGSIDHWYTNSGSLGIGVDTPGSGNMLNIAGGIGISGTTVITSSRNIRTSKVELGGNSENYLEYRTSSQINSASTNVTQLRGRRVDIYADDDVFLRSGTTDSVRIYGANSEKVVIGYHTDIVAGDFRVDGTTVIDSSRNLTNIGTISSGAITSSGTLTLGSASNVAAAHSAGDDFVIKGVGTAVGLTISQDSQAGTGSIFFGDPVSSTAGGIRYNHNTGDMAISAEDYVNFDVADGLQINATTVIDSSRKAYLSDTTITGSSTSLNQNALLVENSEGTDTARFRNDGTIIFSGSNYLYITKSAGLYVENSIKARGGINNDGGDLVLSDTVSITGSLKMGSTTVIDSSRNITATTVGVTNIVTNKVVKFNGTILDDSNITDTGSAITLGSATTVSGNLTVSGNTNAGHIYSGTSGGTQGVITAYFTDGSHTLMTGYGITMSRGSSYIRPTADDSQVLKIGHSSGNQAWASVGIDSTSGLSLNGINFINESGNIGAGGAAHSSYDLKVYALSRFEGTANFVKSGAAIQVGGQTVFDSDRRAYVSDGSSSAPSLSNIGDTDTGLWFPSANQVGLEASSGFLVNGAHNNSGKADMAIDIDGNPTISLLDDQVQFGSSDMNYNMRMFYTGDVGYLESWDNHLYLKTTGSSGSTSTKDIVFYTMNGAGSSPEALRVKSVGTEVSGYLQSGTNGSTTGSITLTNHYVNDARKINTLGTLQSSSAWLLGYAIQPREGTPASGETRYVSSNSSALARSALELKHDHVKFHYAASQTTAIGDDITGLTTPFDMDLTSGDLTLAGDLDVTGNITAANIAKAYTGTVSGVSNSGFTTAFKVVGASGALDTAIRVHFGGTTGSVVVSCVADIQVGHYRDMRCETTSLFYGNGRLTLKIVSDGHDNFAVEVKGNHANTVTLIVRVEQLDKGTVTFTNSHSYSDSTLEHIAYGGKHSSSYDSGGYTDDLRIGGDLSIRKFQTTGSGTLTAPRWDTSMYVMQSQHWYGHNSSQQMFLGESGNNIRVRGEMNIGSDADADAGYKLTVRGDANTTGSFDVAGVITCNQVASDKKMKFRRTGGDNISIEHDSGQIYFYNESDTTPMCKFKNGGDVVATGNVTAYSDQRLKDNIQTLDGSKVMEMRGVSYQRDGEGGSGVIAQELEKVAPELVHTESDEMGTKSVAYGNLVGYLVECCKMQQSQIEALSSEIELLKEKCK